MRSSSGAVDDDEVGRSLRADLLLSPFLLFFFFIYFFMSYETVLHFLRPVTDREKERKGRWNLSIHTEQGRNNTQRRRYYRRQSMDESKRLG